MMDYALVILSYLREDGVSDCLASVMAQGHRPAETLVFHNHPSTRAISGAINVRADVNFGCPARHAAAMLLPFDRYVFVDDDVRLVDSDVCFRLVSLLNAHALVGVCGRDVRPGFRDQYRRGYESRGAGPIDIAKGWCFAARREALLAALQIVPRLSARTQAEDDICLSAAVAMSMGRTPYLAGIAESAFEHVRDELGNERREDHWHRRDSAVAELMAQGWQPPSHSRNTV